MSVDVTTPQDLEAELERLSAEATPPEGGGPGEAEPRAPAEAASAAYQAGRVLATVSTTVLAAAVMVGGIFQGVSPRVYAGLAGLAGLALAWRASRARNPWLSYAWMIGGIFLLGVVLLLPDGLDIVTRLGEQVRLAARQRNTPPPVLFLPGWKVLLVWIMGGLGFAAGWVGLQINRPALGLLVPLPFVAIGAISVPDAQKVASGVAALALFAVGLAILSGVHEEGTEDQAPSAAYEVRRAARALPLIGGVTAVLVLLSRSNLLFPPPLYDPTEQARKPKTIPISKQQDRILFTVKASFTGPWKMGTLDVYDGRDWRLPPYNPKLIKRVPKSGVVDPLLYARSRQRAAATFTIQGLTGSVLPDLPNTVGMEAELPRDLQLSFDQRAGSLRVTQGQVRPGFQYTILAAQVPEIERLRQANPDLPEEVRPFLQVPSQPRAVQDLLKQAPTTNAWDRLDFVRQALLRKVQASGSGVPVPIPPSRVAEMLTTKPQATPFEIVAAQALLARWAGVPARIGYGFDKGDPGPDGTLQIRPKHGALFLEVFFPGFGWLPIIGDPLMAKTSFTDSPQQFSADVQPSDDVAVRLFLPTLRKPPGELFRQARRVAGTTLPAAAGVLLVYYLWPLPYKAARRARRRAWARDRGPEARVALAYAEWRDLCTDYGYPFLTDPPMLFLTRVVPDEEHVELAWLVTRGLWGDLRGRLTVDDAVAAEALSASLRKRLSQAHAWTLRAVAALSRLSIRRPYAARLEDLVGMRIEEVGRAA